MLKKVSRTYPVIIAMANTDPSTVKLFETIKTDILNVYEDADIWLDIKIPNPEINSAIRLMPSIMVT